MIRILRHFCQIIILISGALLMAATPSLADKDGLKATISMTGIGEINASPDIAFVTSGVLSQAKTAAQALAANSAAMTRVIKSLKASNINGKDIQTTGFSVNPSYVYDQKNRQNPPRIVGYQVRNQVKVIVRKREELGAILDKMITMGANQINGISFAIDKPQKLQDEARKRAVTDAFRKAEIYVTATKSKLGRILSLSETRPNQPGRLLVQQTPVLSARTSVPIEAGERTIRAQVYITWELK